MIMLSKAGPASRPLQNQPFLFSHSVVSDSSWRHGPPWTAALQVSLSFRVSQSLLIDVIQPSHPLSPVFPSALNLSQHQGCLQMGCLFSSGGQSIRASASALVLPVNIQVLFPLGLKSLKSSSAFSKMKRSLVFADRLGGFSSVFLVVLLSTVRPPSLRPFEGCLINVFC